MKVGIYIAPSHSVPPEKKNILAPWVLVGELVDGLANRGNEVYIFAASKSKTKGILKDFGIRPTVEYQDKLSTADFQKKVVEDEEKLFDGMISTALEENIKILHIHQIKRMYDRVKRASEKLQFVFTLHDPIDEKKAEEIQQFLSLGNCHFVSISNAQRGSFGLKFVDTVYNGIDLSHFPYYENPQPHRYLTAGRIVRPKGYEDAIETVRKTGVDLTIAGQVYEDIPDDKKYWKEEIKPFVDDKKIVHYDDVERDFLSHLYREARALIFPIKWEEPFGLVMIEAMACGTPVIGYDRGSVAEVVKDGETGYIINPKSKIQNPKSPQIRNPAETEQTQNFCLIGRQAKLPPSLELRRAGKTQNYIIKKEGVVGLIEAIRRIENMDEDEYQKMRTNCRQHVEEKFTVEKMVDGYERVYQQISNFQ